jgi:hypothetical protein
MKKFNLQFLLIMLAFVTVFTSCDKDDDETPISKEDLLTNKKWRTTAFTVDPAYFGISDLYAQYEDCDKDDFMESKKGGQLVRDEGASRCDSSDPQTLTGTWIFNGDQTKITVNDPEIGTYPADVLELTNNTLRVQFTIRDDDSGLNYTFKSTQVKM